MRRGTALTVYKCVCCNEEYKSKKAAADCSQYSQELKVGDVIEYGRYPYLVAYEEDDRGLVTIDPIPAYAKLRGLGRRDGYQVWSVPTFYFCKNKPVRKWPVSDAEKDLEHYCRRHKYAETFLNLLKGKPKK